MRRAPLVNFVRSRSFHGVSGYRWLGFCFCLTAERFTIMLGVSMNLFGHRHHHHHHAIGVSARLCG